MLAPMPQERQRPTHVRYWVVVFAVALACWALRKRYPRRRGNGWWQNGYQDEARKLLLF